MSAEIVALGIGMMTAVGIGAAETAASIRSGTARFSETSLRDKRFAPFKIALVPDDALPPVHDGSPGLSAREERMLRLAKRPLHEAIVPLQGRATAGICLALPEIETTRPIDRPAFLRHLVVQSDDSFDLSCSDASHVGRAGGLTAIGQAAATIERGVSDFMVAGGVDTYRDLYILGVLDQEQRIKSALNLDGFIPGEGAAFVLLGRRRAAASLGLVPLATVSPVALGFEPGHLYSGEPYRGEGLAAAISQLATTGAVTKPVAEVFSSMNGENHWAKEWGVTFIRTRGIFEASPGMHHPADCVGDTGAAAGALLVAMAMHGISGRYRRSPALVYGSGDHGARAALIVSGELH